MKISMAPASHTLSLCWALLACSAQALSGFLRPGDELALGGLVPPALLQQEDAAPSIPIASDIGGLMSPDAPGPTLIRTHLLSHREPDEEAVRSMDTNQDSVVSSLELDQAINRGHLPAPARQPAQLRPGQASARFFLGLRSASAGVMPDVRVTALAPGVATASFGLVPVKPGSQHVANSVREGPGGSFIQESLGQSLAAELRVNCACHAAGVARFQVMVATQGEASPAQSFVFDKSCHGDQLHGFDVGTTAFGKDVIDDGAARWVPTNLPVVAYEQSTVDLYVSARHGMSSITRELKFESPVVRVWNVKVIGKSKLRSAALQARTFSTLGTGEGKLSADAPTKLTVAFKCLEPSTALIEIMLVPKNAWDPYRPVSIFLKKECHGGFKQGFNVGMVRGASDLVHDGRAQPQVADVSSREGFSQFFVEHVATSQSDIVRPALHCTDEHQDGHAPLVSAQLSVKEAGDIYNVSYKCNRPGVAVCTISLTLGFWKPVELRWRKRCGGTAADVIVESSFAQSTVVFGGGQASTMWTPKNPVVSLAPTDNVAVFTVRSSQETGMGEQSQALSLLAPKVLVSDATVLDVIVSKEGRTGPSPLVFIARHVCKKVGTSQVTIRLPRGKSEEVDQDPSDQVAFAYRKVCTHSGGMSFLGFQTITRSFGVPTGGWRTLLVVAILFVVGIIMHEFGHRWVSKLIVREIEENMGPELFGTEIKVGSLSFRPWTGVFVLKDFVMKNPPGYAGEYALHAASLSIITAPKQVLLSFGRVVKIRLLRLENVNLQIEFQGITIWNPLGDSNIAVIRDHVSHSYDRHEETQAELDQMNKKPGCMSLFMERRFHDLWEHAVLEKTEFKHIQAEAHHPLLSGELVINDIIYENFSASYPKAVGIRAIMTHVADAFYDAVQHDVLGETGAKVANATAPERRGSMSMGSGDV